MIGGPWGRLFAAWTLLMTSRVEEHVVDSVEGIFNLWETVADALSRREAQRSAQRPLTSPPCLMHQHAFIDLSAYYQHKS